MSKRKTTLGSRTSRSIARSPAREAARNATTRRCSSSFSTGAGRAPAGGRGSRVVGSLRACDRRRRSISSNGIANTSWDMPRAAGLRCPARREGCDESAISLVLRQRGIIGRGANPTPPARPPLGYARQILATTVVSHARRSSIRSVLVRSSRIHASCSASSASEKEPSIRYATPRRYGRLTSNSSASHVRSSFIS
jgi:hypothetical protein